MKEFRKRICQTKIFSVCFLQLIYFPIAFTAEEEIASYIEEEDFLAAATKGSASTNSDTYTVNFNNISMTQMIRFASKLTNLNFIYEDADLQFSATFVSEEPVTAKSIMAALSQLLKARDLILIEQGSNVLITSSAKVGQIPPIITPTGEEKEAKNAALVTRIFRIKNANPTAIADIIRPMISPDALIEVFAATRQLIVTDIVTNIDQIGVLLEQLDSSHSPLEMETYTLKYLHPDELIALTEKILDPFKEGNPLLFVPQNDTNSIFLISTPYLIEKALTVMEDLDVPPQSVIVASQGMTGKNVFVYKAINRPPQELVSELKLIGTQLHSLGGAPTPLEMAISSVQVIKNTSSLMFIANPETTDKLINILSTLDTPQQTAQLLAEQKSTFLVYNPKYRSGEELYEELNDLKTSLQSSKLADPGFLQTLDSMKWIASTKSLVFTGNATSIERIRSMLDSLDTPIVSASKTSEVFVYKPQYVSADQIKDALNSLIPPLQSTHNSSDSNLAKAIESMQWNSQTQSFMVTADPGTVERLKHLLSSIDTPQGATPSLAKGFFLYKLEFAKCEEVIEELKNIAKKMPASSLQNEHVITTIDHIECIPSNNSLLITGTQDAIEQVKTLVAEFDVEHPPSLPTGAQSFLIYKPKYLSAQALEGALSALSSDLQSSGLNDPPLFQTLHSMRYVSQTQSLLFTGTAQSLDKLQNLINSIDTSAALGSIQNIGNLTFLIYKIQSASPEKLISSLKNFAKNLEQTKAGDKDLINTLNDVKWIKETNSLLFTGTTNSLEKVDQIVKKFDIGGPHTETTPISDRIPSTFIIYTPRYVGGDELIAILCEFMDNLMEAGISDPGLFDTINNLKWISKTSSLLISGDPTAVDKVEQLLVKFDIPSKETTPPSIESIDNVNFLVYKLQYHPGNEIQTALKQVAVSLAKAGSSPTSLVEAIDSLQWIEITNSLLVTGQQDVLIKLRELIQNLDVPLRQVFIEVLVIQTNLSSQQDFGLMWGGQLQYLNKTVLQTGNFPVSSSQGSSLPSTTFPTNLQSVNGTTTPNNKSIPFTSGFDLGVIGDIIMHKGKSFLSLGSLLNAIQLDSDSTVLLNPKIITQDNRQSTVFVGQNIPYTGALVTNIASNTTSTANIEYRDVGVSLTITPILGDGDVITMDIIQDISQVVNGQNVTTSNQQLTGIQTTHTHMETRVHVPDNHFVALTGMINDNKTHFRTAIPCLGGLPVIGFLFSENDRVATKSNIVVFVRPEIITSYKDYKRLTEHQEWLFKDNAKLPVLKEEFDEGIDMVKLPENE